MSARVINSRPTYIGTVLLPVLCLLAFTQVACDQSKTEEPVERAQEATPSDPVQQASTDPVQQAGQIVTTPQSKTVIAPGNIVVMALSSYDQRAVVKSADGEMQAMKPGDIVPGTETVLVDVLNDRLVLEQTVTMSSGLKVKQTVWVYKARDGVSRVQVLNRNAPELKEYKVTKTIVTSE